MEIKCVNCGAVYEEGSHYCPYCGHITPENAEAKYMESLEDIRDDLSELEDDGEEAVVAEGRSLVKKIVITVALVIGLLVIALCIYNIPRAIKDKANAKWQVENYPKFQKIYDEGDYETLLKEYDKAKQDDKPVYGFNHSAFCEALGVIEDAKEALSYIESDEEADDYWRIELFCVEMKCFAFEYKYGLTSDEKEILKEMAEPYMDDATLRYALTSEELDKWMEKAKNDAGNIYYTDCKKYLKDKGMLKEG